MWKEQEAMGRGIFCLLFHNLGVTLKWGMGRLSVFADSIDIGGEYNEDFQQNT